MAPSFAVPHAMLVAQISMANGNLMTRRASRFLLSCAAGVLFAPALAGSAWASDGGEDGAIVRASDGSVPVDGSANCIAIGEPCTANQTCCNPEAYCGSFGGAGGALACGSNESNSLGTGSCSSTGGSSTDGFGFVGALGLAVAVGLHRTKRLSRAGD